MSTALPSYVSGISDKPMLGDTIGDNLERTVAHSGTGTRWSTTRPGAGGHTASWPTRSTGWRWACSPRGIRQGRPGRHLVSRTVPSGPSSNTRRQRSARSWSTSIPPTGRMNSSTCSNQAGVAMLVAAPVVQDLRLRGDDRAGRAEVRRARAGDLLGAPEWERLFDAGRAPVTAPSCGGRNGELSAGRPDQHPIHLGHNGFPEGCDAQPPQHPEQRVLRRRAVRSTPSATGSVHPGAVLPLLRHGDGQPGVHDARCGDGDPGAGVRPEGDPAGRG